MHLRLIIWVRAEQHFSEGQDWDWGGNDKDKANVDD